MNATDEELATFINSDFDSRPLTRTERLDLYGSQAEWRASVEEDRRERDEG